MAGVRKRTRAADSEHAKLAANLKRKYEKGESIRQLAESTGRSYGFVHKVLTEAGVKLRGRQGQPAKDEREEAHRLVKQVPASRVPEVTDLLREFVESKEGEQPPRRRFRTIGVFEGEPDLGRRAKEVARLELGRTSGKSA